MRREIVEKKKKLEEGDKPAERIVWKREAERQELGGIMSIVRSLLESFLNYFLVSFYYTLTHTHDAVKILNHLVSFHYTLFLLHIHTVNLSLSLTHTHTHMVWSKCFLNYFVSIPPPPSLSHTHTRAGAGLPKKNEKCCLKVRSFTFFWKYTLYC